MSWTYCLAIEHPKFAPSEAGPIASEVNAYFCRTPGCRPWA